MADKNTETDNTTAQTKKSCKPSACKAGIFIAMIVVLAMIAAMVFGYYRLFTANQNLTRTVASFKNTFDQSTDLMTQAQRNSADMQQVMQEIAGNVKTQQQAIDALQQAQHSGADGVVVAQAEYLVKIANDSLQFERNLPLAMQLLSRADQSLANLSDPKLYAVRQAISADMTALQSAASVDVPGVYLQLNSLSVQLDKVPIANQFILSPAPAVSSDETANLPWWRRALQSAWQALQHIVIIRHAQSNALPFVTPDQQVFLTQNLRAEVEQAKWALLHHQGVVYRASLQQVTNWIKQYAVPDAPMTKDVLTQLAQLQAVNVEPTPLNLENSLRAFQAYVKGK